jgi:hypothetical protein
MGIQPTLNPGFAPFYIAAFAHRVLQAMKTIHISEMIAEGGRDGTVRADGAFAVDPSSEEREGSATEVNLSFD